MSRKPWKGSFEPLKIFGNLYFVGTPPASVHIVDTGEGLIMLNTGYSQSLYIVIDNIYRIGLDPHNIKYILFSDGDLIRLGNTTVRAVEHPDTLPVL